MMNKLLVIHFLVTLLASICLWNVKIEYLYSFVVGSALIFLNWIFLGSAWKRILDKKGVAWGVLIIVFKYAIFGIILLVANRYQELNLIGLLGGISTILFTTILSIPLYKWLNKEA